MLAVTILDNADTEDYYFWLGNNFSINLQKARNTKKIGKYKHNKANNNAEISEYIFNT